MSLYGHSCCCSSDDCRQFGCQILRRQQAQPPSYGPSYYYPTTRIEPPEVTLARAIERLAAAIERMAQSAPAAHAEAAE
jgi:hypothetical protein